MRQGECIAGVGRSGAEVIAQRFDFDVLIPPQREHRTVPGDDHVSTTAPSTLENAIIGFVRQDLDSASWTDNNTQIGQEDCNPAQFIGIAGELPSQHSQKFVDDRSGNDQLVFAIEDSSNGGIRPAAWKNEGRNEDVGIEDNPQSLRYRRRSFSVRMPLSRAFLLQ